jgi:hypothetical protein
MVVTHMSVSLLKLTFLPIFKEQDGLIYNILYKRTFAEAMTAFQ